MGAWQRFWRRRQYIVDVKLQLSVVGLVLFSNLIFICALAAALFIPLALAMDRSTHPLAPEARQILALDRKFWPAAGLGAIIVSLMSLALSHRIAGPMVRIKGALNGLIAGQKVRPVRLRRKDFFKDVAHLVDDLRVEIDERNQVAAAELKTISLDVDSATRGRIENVIKELEPVA